MIRFGGEYLNWTLDGMLDALLKKLEIKGSHFLVFKKQQQTQLIGGNYTRPVQQDQKERLETASVLFK